VIQPFIGRRYEPILAPVDVIEQTKSASMNRILLICAAAGDRISSKARLSHSLVGSVLGAKLIFLSATPMAAPSRIRKTSLAIHCMFQAD
jgi:hypothetical protein